MSIAHKSNVIVPHTCRRSTLGFLLHVGLSPEASKRPNKLIPLSSSPVVIPPTTEDASNPYFRPKREPEMSSLPTSTIISTDFIIRSTYPVDFRDDSHREFFLDHHGSFVFCERKGRRQASYSDGSGDSDISNL